MTNSLMRGVAAVCLVATASLSVITFGVAINALVRSNSDKARVALFAAQRNAQVQVDTDDVFAAGAVITAAAILIFVLATIFLLALCSAKSFSRPRLLSVQGGILGLCAIFLFVPLVTFDVFFRTRSATARVFIGGQALSQQLSNGGRLLGIDGQPHTLLFAHVTMITREPQHDYL